LAADADGDGYLVEADFEALTDRCNALQASRPASDHEAMRAITMGWWATLRPATRCPSTT
jgi:hypothetical protein